MVRVPTSLRGSDFDMHGVRFQLMGVSLHPCRLGWAHPQVLAFSELASSPIEAKRASSSDG